jgi:outer membrane protein OmpA-like peptidoglycan-associated protein
MRMIHRVLACTILAMASVGVHAAAQVGNPGQVELGVLGTVTAYDKTDAGLDAGFGAGGRLGLFITRLIAIEVNGDHTPTNQTASGDALQVTRLGGTLYAHTLSMGFANAYLGLGFGRVYYRGARDGDEWGPHGLIGFRIPLGGRAALRIEGRGDLYSSSLLSPANGSAVNLGAAAGLSVFAFGGRPKDTDGDGVPDRRDDCPATPIGAQVDLRGCPLDGDGDGVFNGLDRCPDTPQGALVNAAGCPNDTDADGVFDGIDQCPNTPAGAVVDPNGCPIDSDADGVFDGIDQCPDTPTGATVGPDGCPADSDADGVLDGLDLCPDTPAGARVDSQGCSLDEDRDGVVNAIDQCPGTPQGISVDRLGCPLDSDGDGVPDGLDRCPNTSAGRTVDAVGCPVLFQVQQGVVQPLILRGVNFATGRSALTPDSYAVLDEVATSLLARTEVRVEVAGHTDITGSRALNMRLSLERAQAVKAYLARKGVEPSRMVTRGYGPDEPVATNATAAGRAQNRRVELRRIDQQ